MKKIQFAISLILVFSFFADADAQKKPPSAFATVKISTTSVVLNQPFKLTVSVFTETWFTKAPDVFDLHIPYSFTVSLGRPFSHYETLKGTRYTTLNYEYLIFPARVGEMNIPAIPIRFESPPEGDYKGVAVEVTTPPKTVHVAGIPDDFKGKHWFVANSIAVSQAWNKRLQNLKVGDVIERTITIRATGTVAALIPDLPIDRPAWASIYTKTPVFENEINGNVISSSRQEKIIYLLEKDGEHTIPEIAIDYYNPHQKKMYTKALKGIQLLVKDNPDLAMLKSLQDSLNALNEQAAATERKEFELFGLKIWQLIVSAAAISLIVFLLLRMARKVQRQLQKRKQEYLNSERYLFKQFQRACRTHNYQKIYSSLVQWLDRVSPPQTTKGVINFARRFADEEDELQKFDAYLYGNPKTRPDLASGSGMKLLEYVTQIRKKLLRSSEQTAGNHDHDLPDLNP